MLSPTLTRSLIRTRAAPLQISSRHTYATIPSSQHPRPNEPTNLARGSSNTPFYIIGSVVILGVAYAVAGGGSDQPPKTTAVANIEERLTPRGDAKH